MDPALLTSHTFWNDPAVLVTGSFTGALPASPDLREHVLFATSGSSGAPRWIALSKQALLASAGAVNHHLDVTASSCWGLALPLHHVGGFGVAARAYAAGCTLHPFTRRWEPNAFASWLAAHHITHTSLVPTQVHDLVVSNIQAPAALQAIVVGGGQLDARTGQAARALGWPVLASYGMTEAGSQIATQSPASLREIYQPAPLPVLAHWQLATAADQQLRLAGPALFSGYLERINDHWVYHPRSSEWHQSADRVDLGPQGLTPLGRTDTRVKVLGELVDLESIERELAELACGHLAPGSFAVAAIPDARAQHALVPVFAATVDPARFAAALAAYARQAPGFRRLQPAVILDPFPNSPLGKPRRSEITAAVTASHPV